MRRRTFLGSMGVTAAAAMGCTPPAPDLPPQDGGPFEGIGPFPGGVGSGDPLPDAVLLWTRVAPALVGGGAAEVHVELATSPSFALGTIVRSSAAATGPATDHCVTVDVDGLDPGRTWWYRFRCAGLTSPVGRTRTAADPDVPSERARIAAFSCQRWTHGWYNAHGDLARLAEDPATDVDLVLCLGDYVYDTGYADGVVVPGRHDPVQDAVTLEQFRSKYRLYRSDPQLQAMHALFPVVHVFDNHDGLDQPGDPQADGAVRAFFEHLPVRGAPPDGLERRVAWGDLLEVFLTDQRTHRSPTIPRAGLLGTATWDEPALLDPSRSMLGPPQRDRFLDAVCSTSAVWPVWGSQLMFWPWRALGAPPGTPRGSGLYLNPTQWDGYLAERHAILDRLAADGVENLLVLSGDSHVFSAAQVAPDVDDARSLPRALEFSTGSITSSNADEQGFPPGSVTRPLLYQVNPNHLRWFSSERHGYVVVELDRDRATVEARSPRTIRTPDDRVDVLARFTVERGSQRLVRVA